MANPLLVGAGLVGAGLIWLKLRKPSTTYVPTVAVEPLTRPVDAGPEQRGAALRPGEVVVGPNAAGVQRGTLDDWSARGQRSQKAKADLELSYERERAANHAMEARNAAQAEALTQGQRARNRLLSVAESLKGHCVPLVTTYLEKARAVEAALEEVFNSASALQTKRLERDRATAQDGSQYLKESFRVQLQPLEAAHENAIRALRDLVPNQLLPASRAAQSGISSGETTPAGSIAMLDASLRTVTRAAERAAAAWQERLQLMVAMHTLRGESALADSVRSNTTDESGQYQALPRLVGEWLAQVQQAKAVTDTIKTSIQSVNAAAEELARRMVVVRSPYGGELQAINLNPGTGAGFASKLRTISAGIEQLLAAARNMQVRDAALPNGFAGLGGGSKSMANMRVSVSRRLNPGETRGMETSPIDPNENNVRIGMGSDLADWYGPALIPVGAQLLPQNVGYYGDSGYAKPAFTRALRGVHSLGEPIMVLETIVGGLAGLGHAGHESCQCRGQGANCLCKK